MRDSSKAFLYAIRRFVQILEDECDERCKLFENKNNLSDEETKNLHYTIGARAYLHQVSCYINGIYRDLGGEL